MAIDTTDANLLQGRSALDTQPNSQGALQGKRSDIETRTEGARQTERKGER